MIQPHNQDWTRKYTGHSRLLLRPKTNDEVAAVLKYCNDQRLAVVPQGGNTGLVGGSNPIFDEIIVNMGRMNKILEFDESYGILISEAGCVL